MHSLVSTKQWILSLGLVLTLLVGGLVQAQEEDFAPEGTEESAAADESDEDASIHEEVLASIPVSEPERSGIELGMIGYDANGERGWLHTVKRGETLWDITEAYFGTPWIWPSVWNENIGIENPHRISPGDTLWITSKEIRPVTDAEAAALLAGEPADTSGKETGWRTIWELPDMADEEGIVYYSAGESADLVARVELDALASVIGTPEQLEMFSDENHVIIGAGEGEVKKGERYTVFRNIDMIHHPDTHLFFGYYLDLVAWVEIVEVYEKTAKAKVMVTFSEVRLDDRLLPRVEPVTQVEVKPASKPIQGAVIALSTGRAVAAMDDVLYLDQGSDAGLEAGNVLEIIRPVTTKRDKVRKDSTPRKTPHDVIGTAVVISVRPESSLVLVRTAKNHMEVGDYFRTAANFTMKN